MRKKIKLGFTKTEVIICLTLFLAVVAVSVKVLSSNTEGDKYKKLINDVMVIVIINVKEKMQYSNTAFNFVIYYFPQCFLVCLRTHL